MVIGYMVKALIVPSGVLYYYNGNSAYNSVCNNNGRIYGQFLLDNTVNHTSDMRCTVLGGGVILTDDFSIIRSFMGPKNPSYLVIALLYCVILSDCLQFYSVILSDIYCIICPQFYVFCDSTGSPTHFVTPAGDLEREVGRAPFGRVTFDSDEASIADRVPVGFAGGVVDDDVGLVHIQVQKMSNIRALCITVLIGHKIQMTFLHG